MISQKKHKIAVIHSGSKWIGGAEAVAVWTIEALKEEYNVTLISGIELPLDQVNGYYGTSLKPGDFCSVIVRLPFDLGKSSKFWYLRQLMLMRYCRKIAEEHDLWISTYYEMDLGRRGIQYVHSPAVAVGVVKGLDAFLDENQRSFLKGLYRKSVARIFNLSVDNIRQNLTLVNSKWTGQLIKRAYGIDPYVVYPPVSTKFPHIPWDAREEGFVCIGRIAPSKRIDSVIQILKRVREAGWDVHLHIVGEIWDLGYARKIEKLQRENSDWVFLEGRLTREQLADLVARHKYGIHGMRDEHFGIAVAEMVKAGNIVFVPNDGGQVEVVGDKSLIYSTEDEAIKKIISILQDQRAQLSLKEALSEKASFFSEKRFMERIREIVDRELKKSS